MTKDYNWYILNVVAGQEGKVAADINSLIARGATKDFIKEVVIPAKQVIKVKRGKKTQDEQKLFPGYVFINTNLDGNTFSIVNSIPKVVGFLGGKNNPSPVSQDKVDAILKSIEEQAEQESDAMYEVGEVVKINDGPFESFTGTVEKFDSEKKKVKISVSIFGRATNIELDPNQIEKVS